MPVLYTTGVYCKQESVSICTHQRKIRDLRK
jgi:hypothetical protein